MAAVVEAVFLPSSFERGVATMAGMAEELSAAQVAELEAALGALVVELEAALEHSADEAKPVDLEEPIGRLSRIDARARRVRTVPAL